MSEKGQITLEALLVFGVFIIILVSVSMPLALKSKKAADDVAIVSDAGYALEQAVAAANSVNIPGAKRSITVYVPGLTSAERTITTTISTDGDNLTATVSGISGDDAVITKNLHGSNWRLYNGTTGSEASLSESSGGRYNFIITWENITYQAAG